MRARASRVANMRFFQGEKKKHAKSTSEEKKKPTTPDVCKHTAHKAVNNREPTPLAAIHAHVTMLTDVVVYFVP